MDIKIKTSLPPAQLWIGQHEHLAEKIESYIQSLFCLHNACQVCAICMNIRNKQHHSLMWFYPEKLYTIDQLDDLFEKITFSLDSEELFFFIIQKADYLTTACANKLLKSIEEPPPGYHFILLASNKEHMLPTITSRCIMQTLYTHNVHSFVTHPLITAFTTEKLSAMEFSKIIDSLLINERDTIHYLDEIMNYWINQYKNDLCNTTHARIFDILHHAYAQLPMPGSIAIFWHNLYLRFYACNNITK